MKLSKKEYDIDIIIVGKPRDIKRALIEAMKAYRKRFNKSS
jgi:hypothetical protein